MGKVVEDDVALNNIDAETCKRIYGGKPMDGNKCRVRMVIDDDDPKHARIIQIEDDERRVD